MKINLRNKEECYGCKACYFICPVHAIEMNEDEEGFLYPKINEKLCVSCGKCKKVCDKQIAKNKQEPLQYFAVKNKDLESRQTSSSGGAFSLLAKYVENNNGAIYGVGFGEDFKIEHKRALKYEEWKEFKGSKYMQSDLKETYREVEEDLKEKRKVLFTGTPCQIDGLNKYLGNIDKENLITCDCVCHGVPSPKIWKKYIKYIMKKYKTNVDKISFRDKNGTGWHNNTITVKDKLGNNILKEKMDENFFCLLFFNHYILRPSCYKCKYANFNRVGDITLGDFWGIEKKYPEFDDDKGVSLVLINSSKGMNVWNEIKRDTDYKAVEKEDCIQPNLCQPSYRPENRDFFWEKSKKWGIIFAGKRVGCMNKNKIDKFLILMDRVFDKIKRL